MTFEPCDHAAAPNCITVDCATEHGSVCSSATCTNGIISAYACTTPFS